MSDFVEAADPAAVEAVLSSALRLLGAERVVDALAAIVPVRQGREGGLFRGAQPDLISVGDRALWIDEHGRAQLQHVVGGVALSTEQVSPPAFPGVLAAMVVRSVTLNGTHDAASVLLTSLRDAVASGS